MVEASSVRGVPVKMSVLRDPRRENRTIGAVLSVEAVGM